MASQAKMLQMQAQIRQNTVELQDYLHDLDSWEQDMKKKDETFTKMKPKNEVLPPVRSVTQAKKHTDVNSNVKPKKLKSYDYRSWDKLNVDKMLDEIDAKEEEMEAHKAEEKAEVLKKNHKQLSAEEKDKGNDHFKAARYEKAIDCYTKGMQYDPSSAVLPANRAMAYLKLKRFVECEADCALSLSLDPMYVKAYLRRGSARVAMAKLEGAIRDFNDVLKLEPENRQAKIELEKIKIQEQKNLPRSEEHSDAPSKNPVHSRNKSRLVLPITKPRNLQSKKPLRRIHVEEVGDVSNDVKRTSDCNGHVDDPVSKRSEAEKTNDVSATTNPSSTEAARDSSSAELRLSEKIATSREDQKQEPFFNDVTSLPSAPTTFIQFQADVKKLRRQADVLFAYLKQLDPANTPALLKDQLDSFTLVAILESCAACAVGNEIWILDLLSNLCKAKRFDMAVMFFTSTNKTLLRSLFDSLMKGPVDVDLLNRVRCKFGC